MKMSVLIRLRRYLPVFFLSPSLLYLLVSVVHLHLMPLDNDEIKPAKIKSLQDHVLEKQDLIPYSALNRGYLNRNAQLSQARAALEYWWSINKVDNKMTTACPLSVLSKPPDILKFTSDEDKERQLFYQLQGIAVMEALGYSDVTTCQGRYSRVALDPKLLREGKDNLYKMPNEDEASKQQSIRVEREIGRTYDGTEAFKAQLPSAPTKEDEDKVVERLCYEPIWRPQLNIYLNNETTNASDIVSSKGEEFYPDMQEAELPKPGVSPDLCPRLLELHKDILAGREPPLLTLFTWIPDPFEDSARKSRIVMLKNMKMLRPFVKSVLVSDRRNVMAIAHKLRWPCLPVRHYSLDNLPIFKPIVQDLIANFNSTFYGYAQATSAFDSSLLETLLAVKDEYLSPSKVHFSNQGRKVQTDNSFKLSTQSQIFLYGSAMYKNNLKTTRNLSNLGLQAKCRGKIDWSDTESSFVYFIHTKMSFSDLPPLQIADKALTSLLVERSKLLGHTVLDASNTVLCVMNNMVRRTEQWNSVDLKDKSLNKTYNLRLAHNYISALKHRTISWHSIPKPTVLGIDEKGAITFDAP